MQAEGFRLYGAIGRVWAHQLGEEECALSFPAGKFIAAWGEPMAVAPRDWIVTPHPAANEVYRIEVDAFATLIPTLTLTLTLTRTRTLALTRTRTLTRTLTLTLIRRGLGAR